MRHKGFLDGDPLIKHYEPEILGLHFKIGLSPDFFVSYSQSSYIQTLVNNINEFGSKLSILDIFMKINHESSDSKKKEAFVTIIFTLSRRLVLKPKTPTDQ